ncbi:unnamed protein product [Clonostachys rosea f. rosea IK726]|uniref:FAD-binding FR-type domain-containing protein n=2 Tax=Bionectria ochroleuca TaxID=29856 RepID=A0A0B7JZQ5_BIOOC|nr:unnamed protein product [Clonostachys rosea f. rosea IK726]
MSTQVETWHQGEAAVQKALKIPPHRNPTYYGLPARFGLRVNHSSLMAVGTLDADGRPWTTLWGGQLGFSRPIQQDVLGINTSVATDVDPVFKALWGPGNHGEGEVVQHENKLMAGLAFEPETRDRVKISGKMIAGAITDKAKTNIQMAMAITQSIGNCPKYIAKRRITPSPIVKEKVAVAHEGLPLPSEAIKLVNNTDLFFLSTTDGKEMGTNHRGGPPGFVRVLSNNSKAVELVYPEYSGNRFYSTLGNLKVNPLVGIVIPDFDTGDALYLTGSTSLLFGEEASSVLARTQVAVKITVSDAKFIRQCLPFRGPLVDHSPYNPPVRYLTNERAPNTAPLSSSSSISATLINKEPITPTVNRFTFRLSSKPKWVAGQHVTFDFHDEVSGGYSHMNDSDPQSLNDDYIRTFTVSSRPEEENLQITVRRNGPVTGFLWRQNVNAQLEIPVMGFGGKEEFHLPVPASPSSEDGKATGPSSVFVAGGVGITPILAQAGPIVASGGSSLAVLWTLKREDANFAIDSFERIPGLASATRLFLTGKDNSSPTVAAQIEKLKSMGSHVTERRIGEDDLEPFKREGVRYYICAAPVLMRQVNAWLEGLDVVTEDFGY